MTLSNVFPSSSGSRVREEPVGSVGEIDGCCKNSKRVAYASYRTDGSKSGEKRI